MNQLEHVALIGAGAIGTLLAHHLAASGRPVVVCGRTQLHRLAVSDDDGTHEAPVTWVATPDDLPPVGWAILATKIQDTPAVAAWLDRLSSDAYVIGAQNGVDQQQRVGAFTAARVVPAIVYANSERIGPGHVRTHRTGRGLVVPDDEGGRAVARLYQDSRFQVETVRDFRTAGWEKLLINVVVNPLTALTGRRMEVLGDPSVRTLALDVAHEMVAVARAEGARLTEDHAESIVDWVRTLPPDLPTSMLSDRNAGRPMEHDGLLGPAVALGERHGVPTPTTRAILALLRALPVATR